MTWMPKKPAPAPRDFHINDLYLNSNINDAGYTYSRCFSLFFTYNLTYSFN